MSERLGDAPQTVAARPRPVPPESEPLVIDDLGSR